MKIDEACINHNLVNIAKDSSGWIIETNIDEESMKCAVVNLAYLAGACELADRLKVVLKE